MASSKYGDVFDDLIVTLKEVEGLSRREIGLVLGVDKNVISGRSGRLGLKGGKTRRDKSLSAEEINNLRLKYKINRASFKPVSESRLPILHQLRARNSTELKPRPEAASQQNVVTGESSDLTYPRRSPARLPVVVADNLGCGRSIFESRIGPCSFPIGDPRKPSFHYCNGKALPGKPYCAEHAAITYVPQNSSSKKYRREDAA